MASLALKFIFCFLVVFCFINHNVEAREGKVFFSKFTHIDRLNNKEVVAQPPAPATSPPGLGLGNGRLGDGPFGPGSGMIPQTKESWPVSSSTTTTDEEFEKLMATFDEEKGENLPQEFEEVVQESESEDLSGEKDKYNNNNNGYAYTTNNNYNDNRRGYGNEEERQENYRNSENAPSRGYESARGNGDRRGYGIGNEEGRQGMSDTRFMENGKNFYDTKSKSSENTPSRGYESVRGNGDRRGYGNGNGEEGRQGMSDTRFMENGKYFYDTKGKTSENTPSRGYEGVGGNGNDHPNEFETMEEYYKSMEGPQEEYQP